MLARDHARFRTLFDSLMGYALNHGIRFEDAQDLVAGSIEAALRNFDPGRGAFPALCQTTLSNRIKNYWRDRKPVDPFPEDDSISDPDGEVVFFDDPGHDAARLEKIMAELTDTEKQFLVQMRQVLEEIEDRAVSETSRRLGIDPTKGWDIFRRIQRKARQLEPPAPSALRVSASESAPTPAVEPMLLQVHEIEADRSLTFYARSTPEMVPEDIRSLARFAALHAAFETVVGALDVNERTLIEALL